jgi:four helix bundle protein
MPHEAADAVATSLICERSFEFAGRTVDLCERLWDRGPGARHIASQLLRCGTSIGANAEEAQEAQTKPDFIAKMNISRKEARETCYWLRLAIRTKRVSAQEVEWERREATELRMMIVAAIRTARSSPRRGNPV